MSQLTTDPAEISRMARRMMELKLEHRDLDGAIARLQADVGHDEIALRRMKKRKLQLKDQITWLEGEMTPDEPA